MFPTVLCLQFTECLQHPLVMKYVFGCTLNNPWNATDEQPENSDVVYLEGDPNAPTATTEVGLKTINLFFQTHMPSSLVYELRIIVHEGIC